MRLSISYTTEDAKGNGGNETLLAYGDNVTLDKVRKIEELLMKTRVQVYGILQGK